MPVFKELLECVKIPGLNEIRDFGKNGTAEHVVSWEIGGSCGNVVMTYDTHIAGRRQ